MAKCCIQYAHTVHLPAPHQHCAIWRAQTTPAHSNQKARVLRSPFFQFATPPPSTQPCLAQRRTRAGCTWVCFSQRWKPPIAPFPLVRSARLLTLPSCPVPGPGLSQGRQRHLLLHVHHDAHGRDAVAQPLRWMVCSSPSPGRHVLMRRRALQRHELTRSLSGALLSSAS